MSDTPQDTRFHGANILSKAVGATFYEKDQQRPFLTLHPNFATADEALEFAQDLVSSSQELKKRTHQILINYQNPAILIRTYDKRG